MKKVHLHEMRLSPEWFAKISNGTKLSEARMLDKKRQELKVGDVVLFNGTLSKLITAIRIYDSFEEMSKHENLQTILPGYKSWEQGLNEVYLEIYPKEERSKWKVIVFDLLWNRNFFLMDYFNKKFHKRKKDKRIETKN